MKHLHKASLVANTLLPAPVQCICGVWRLTRKPGGYHVTWNAPGHLLHLVVKGHYRIRTNGREYNLRAGDLIYYHETEQTEWLGNEDTVVFYSVAFLAPTVGPLPPEARLSRAGRKVRAAFDRLYEASRQSRGTAGALAQYSALFDVLRNLTGWNADRNEIASETTMSWWSVEDALRARRLFRARMADLVKLAHRSRASLVRDCRAATSASPMRRLRDIRMAEARGLLFFSSLTLTQVAEYLGYPRVHEFSREFRLHFGCAPSRLTFP